MRSMGFSHIAQDLVYRSISNIRYRVSVNGFHSSEFGISPLLFIMAQQILSFNLNNKQERGGTTAVQAWSTRRPHLTSLLCR